MAQGGKGVVVTAYLSHSFSDHATIHSTSDRRRTPQAVNKFANYDVFVACTSSVTGVGTALVRSNGTIDIHFLGHSFHSANVGIAATILAAATVVFVLVRLLKRLKELAAIR